MNSREMTIVIPAHNREKTLGRCLESIIQMKVFQDGHNSWEVFVIDDASTDKTKEIIRWYVRKYKGMILGLNFRDHLERVYGFNAGMRYAVGRWIMHLDSDDILMPHTAQAIRQAIGDNPGKRLFNWGSIVHWRDQLGNYTKSTIREPFHPPMDGQNVGVFGSGQIFSGGFCFSRRLFEYTGYLPNAKDPYTLGKKFFARFPETKKMFPENKYDLGNPFGQDYIYYYMLTRKEVPVVLDQYLHVQYVRQ